MGAIEKPASPALPGAHGNHDAINIKGLIHKLSLSQHPKEASMAESTIHDLNGDPLLELLKQASIDDPASQMAQDLYQDYERWSEAFSEK